MDDSKEKMSSRYNRTNIWTYEPKHRTYEPKSLQHHTHDLHMFKPDGVLALRGRSGYGIQSLRSFLQLIPTGKRKIIFPQWCLTVYIISHLSARPYAQG